MCITHARRQDSILKKWLWNRPNLKMRGWNQNLEEKFEIVIKFRFERYIIVIGLMTCAEVFIEICFPRLRNVEFDENFDHNIYNLSLIYIIRCGILWQFQISIQNFDSAHAFREITDFEILRGRISKFFVALNQKLNFESYYMHIVYVLHLQEP